MKANLATKTDWLELQAATKSDLQELRGEFHEEFHKLRGDFQELKSEFRTLEHRLIIKMGIMTVTIMSLLLTLFKLSL